MVNTLFTMLSANFDRLKSVDGVTIVKSPGGNFIPAVTISTEARQETLPIYANEFRTKEDLDSLEKTFMAHAKGMFDEIRVKRGWHEKS